MADEPEETSDYAVERFDPADGGPIMAYEHVHRYAACAEIVRGKRVLDVASGEGYGAALLARTAQHVTGADVDGAVVVAAAAKYGADGLEFLEADMFELPFDDDSFEVVTCFEAIEHVSKPGRALDEIARVLAPGGAAVISTPDKAVYSDAADYDNEFHLHEFYEDEFRVELGKRFSSVFMMGQRTRAGSELVPLDPSSSGQQPVISYFPDPENASNPDIRPPLYLIAVCRNGVSPDGAAEMVPGVFLDGSDRLVDEYVAAVHAAASIIGDKDEYIVELGARLAEREAAFTELSVEIVGARAYAVEIGRQYDDGVAKEKALLDELLRVTRESEERGVYLLAGEERLAELERPDERPA